MNRLTFVASFSYKDRNALFTVTAKSLASATVKALKKAEKFYGTKQAELITIKSR